MLLSSALSILIFSASGAQEACAPLPRALSGWTVSAGEIVNREVPPGRRVLAQLVPVETLQLTGAGPNAKDEIGQGTVLSFRVERAGIWRVALADPMWIDVLSGGVVAKSIAHGHGQACSGIAKYVDFQLKPGEYRLELAGAEVSRTTLMLALLDPAG